LLFFWWCCLTVKKQGKNVYASAVIKMILVWMPSDSSLQYHMAEVHVVGLGEQLKG
jgi:hypothetical protein